MKICEENKCTGCFACLSVCPKHCISMQENEYGELHPKVDEKLCVNCKACFRTCPNNKDLPFRYPSKCYASWITDNKKRCICASGGIGTIMAEYVIKVKHGIVFGTAYDKDLIPQVVYTETLEGIEKFKGSKYVQSIVGVKTLRKVREFLLSDRFVLFIGTPCQIAGLKSFLHDEFDNLITVDLICHGVSPTRYFVDEINYLCKKKRIPKESITDIRFRGNDDNNYVMTFWDKFKRADSNNFALTIWRKLGGGKIVHIYKGEFLKEYYLTGFLLGITLRENCYKCNYARPQRVSDITIGDFIGLGSEIPFDYSTKNVSSVMINTEKGKLFYEALSSEQQELVNIERPYEERLIYKPSLVEPFKRHPLTDAFRMTYLKRGYVIASRSTLRNIVWKKRIRSTIAFILSPMRLILKK